MAAGVAGQIYYINKHRRLYGTTMSVLYKIDENIVIIILIFELELYFHYLVIRMTLNLNNEKWKQV